MQHGGGSHSGADIGRAGGEVAKGGREGEFEFVLEGRVELVGRIPRFEKVEPWAEGLEANMILFIDHYGEGFVPIYNEATSGVFCGVLATDEVFFDQELFVERS